MGKRSEHLGEPIRIAVGEHRKIFSAALERNDDGSQPRLQKTTVDEYPTRASIAVLEGMDALEPDMETRLAQIRVYVVGMVVLVNQLHHELVHLVRLRRNVPRSFDSRRFR